MKKDKIDLIRAVGDIDDKYVEEADIDSTSAQAEKPANTVNISDVRKKKRASIIKWTSIAASVLLVAGISVAVISNGSFKGKDKNEAVSDLVVDSGFEERDAEIDSEKTSKSAEKHSESSAEAVTEKEKESAKESEAKYSEETEEKDSAPDEFINKIDGDEEPVKESEAEYELVPDRASETAKSDTPDTIGDDTPADAPVPADETIPADEPYDDGEPDASEMPGYKDNNQAEALLLTAGTWNDNKNWGFFTNLVNTGAISFPAYGLNPINRVAVKVVDESGNPVVGQKVSIRWNFDKMAEAGFEAEGEGPVWYATTNKSGYAFLFLTGMDHENDADISATYGFKVEVYDEESNKLETAEDSSFYPAKPDEQDGVKKSSVISKEMTLTVKSQSKAYTGTQVMFILDTTGSMGDEIAYLQKDFSKIVEDVNLENVQYSVNFYRDKDDDYVTKCNPFSDDIKEIQSLLNNEYAAGGGDTPEAVAEILDECLNSDEWKDGCAKVAFLIFDAPPHDGKEEKILKAVKNAAAKGIKVVPVVASNADRETELFGRALAAMTNADYVFLTDDSGIGDSHLEPIIGDYEVEKLHDIIVRLIEEYGV